jgi:hypothetical protein
MNASCSGPLSSRGPFAAYRILSTRHRHGRGTALEIVLQAGEADVAMVHAAGLFGHTDDPQYSPSPAGPAGTPLAACASGLCLQLMELGLVEMREDVPHLTISGQNATWKD